MSPSSTHTFLKYSIAMVTPFREDGEFDPAAIPAVVHYYIHELQAPGLLISGSTGDQHCMTVDERKQLYKAVCETAPQGYPIYAGVAAFKTKDAVELAKAAEAAGCTAIMLGLPPYRKPSQRDLESYVAAVAADVMLPLFLYNNPGRNGVQVEPTTFLKLADTYANVRGIKETGVLENVQTLKDLLGSRADEYTFFTGSDDLYVHLAKNRGFTALTSMAGNFFPKEMRAVTDHLDKKEFEQAEAIMADIIPKYQMIKDIGVLPAMKYVLRKRGAPVGYCPPPLLDPTEEQKKRLDAFV
ncbi:hypothetical protein BDF20DRAFT_824122 [Mycotypha africana]|uniref:uncharacterized protein n=1 Tax=Mycotypha africana TaxID=64632 RepID=UPI00230182D1|nr:uncharacterized protein BDF20DRAFT_824122 [Mycotypha africana]KAI8973671.1 hypothetical protein BDF20DRAFT_824122 [Mycotypha africana]